MDPLVGLIILLVTCVILAHEYPHFVRDQRKDE